MNPGLCVCAPTGSGKTLAYLLPIVDVLLAAGTRTRTQLRAVVIVPSRDLVAQVQRTAEALCRGTGLVVGTATGQRSLAREQRTLVGVSDVGELVEAALGTATEGRAEEARSAVDVLVATPGRLVEHVRGTRGFSLKWVRYLVVDEADRLVGQTYQDWLAEVLRAIGTEGRGAAVTGETFVGAGVAHPVTKMLFSATLTSNPEKLATVELVAPRLFTTGDGDRVVFTKPAGLTELYAVVTMGNKPLVLLHLLATRCHDGAVIIFTASTEASHRCVTRHSTDATQRLRHGSMCCV